VALFDTADLLARIKREVDEPAVSEEQGPSDASHDAYWYALMTEAQMHWIGQMAAYAPDEAYIQELLTTADGGLTYTFSKEPMGGSTEIRVSPTGRLMFPGPEWDGSSDYVMDKVGIRFPNQKTKLFSNGPWARYVPMPDIIDVSHQPTLSPTWARILIVHRSCILWARRGGLRDPRPFEDNENEAWFGRPDGTQIGILGQLRQKYFGQGSAAMPQGSVTIFDLGSG